MPDDPAPPPPPDTTRTKFLESSGFKVAVVNTVSLLLIFVHARVQGLPISPDALNMGIDLMVFSWLAAFGIYKTDTSSLRWK